MPDAAPPDDPEPAPPATTITAPPADATTPDTVSVEFAAPGSGVHFECRIDDRPAAPCSSPALYTDLAEGVHTVFVRALTAGNVAGPEASRRFTVDATGPFANVAVSGVPARGALTNLTTTSLTFIADIAASTITCQIDGGARAPCTSPLALSGLADGAHTISFQATVGARIGPAVVWSWTVDTVAPSTRITGPETTADHPVRERLPTLTGTTEPGVTVAIHVIRNCIGPAAGIAVGAADGGFAVRIAEAMPAAANGITAYFARSADVAGNVGCFGPFDYHTDTTPPAVSVKNPTLPNAPSRERRPTLTGVAEVAAQVRIFRGAGCTGPATEATTSTRAGAWAIAIDAATEAATDGPTAYSVQASDAAGNARCIDFTYFTDNTPPASAITAPSSTPQSGLRQRRPTLSGTAETGATIQVFRGDACAGPATATTIATGAVWSITVDEITEAAADGPTVYTALATDAAGVVACSAPFAYHTDNTPPAVAVQPTTTPSTPSSERRPRVTGTSEPSAQVRIFRGAGCTGPATAPVASAGTWTITLDAATEAGPDGLTAYSAQATDSAGNAACTDFAYFTDSTLPAIAITAPITEPEAPLQQRRPTLSGTAELGATIQVFRGAACAGPATMSITADQGAWSLATEATTEAAADGPTVYTARATDAAGLAACSAPLTYYTDNTPPVLTVHSSTTETTPSRELQPIVSGTSEPSTRIRIFRGAACAGPASEPVTSTVTWSIAIDSSLAAQPNGVTAYSAQATDAAGNASCADFAYHTDTIPPAIAVENPTTPSAPSAQRRPILHGFAETAAQIRIFRGAGCTGPATPPVTSGMFTWTVAIDAETEAAADGETAYSAQATDAAGNTHCVEFAYFTDTSPPAVAITAPITTPAAPVQPRRPTLSGTAETGATIQVFRGDACAGPPTTSTVAVGGMWSIATDPTTDAAADGPTIYTARAVDAIGHAACTAPFTYYTDNTRPDTTIVSPAVPTSTNRDNRSFSFTSNEPDARFQCATGSAPFAACSSPTRSLHSDIGPIEFRVRAIDAAGNVDASPAAFTWTRTQAPMIQYALEGDGAHTGAFALDGAPDYTAAVHGADLVAGRFGKALAFRSSPSSKLVAPVKDVLRQASLFAITLWFREDTVRASTGDAALFDNGSLRIFHATAGNELTACLFTVCRAFSYSVGDWHHLTIEYNGFEIAIAIDQVEVARIAGGSSAFTSSTDIELGRGTSFMVDDLRVFDATSFFLLQTKCQIYAAYDRNGSCLNRFNPPMPIAVEFEQTGFGIRQFAPGRVDVYAAQLPSTPFTISNGTLNRGAMTSYWLRQDASPSSSGTVFQTSGVRHSLSGGSQTILFAGQIITLPSLGTGWHHFLYSVEGVLERNPIAKLFVDGTLVRQVIPLDDPRSGTATIGGGPVAYLDSLRAYSVPIDPQTICQLGPSGNWLFSTQTCRLADALPAGLCVDAAAGSDTASGDCAHPFATITRALSAAVPGQAILARPGTYDAARGEVFPLVVGERVALIGDEATRGTGPAPTRIAGCAADPTGGSDDITVILAGARSSISGFDLGCPTRGRVLVVEADGATVRRARVAQAHIAIAHGSLVDTALIGNELIDSDFGIAFTGEPRIEANRITNNGIGLFQQGGSILDAGGGPRGSRGGNQLYCNTILDVSTGASVVRLRDNAWDQIPPLVATVPTGCSGLRTDICLLTQSTIADTAGATLAPAPRCELN